MRRLRRLVAGFFAAFLLARDARAQFMTFASPPGEDYEADIGLMAPPGFLVVYYDSQGPLSFVSPKLSEIPLGAVLLGDVYAKTCQYGIGIPITPPTSPTNSGTSISGVKGNGSFQKAIAELHSKRPEVAGIYDVKIDSQLTTILTIFKRECIEIHARGFSIGK